MGKTVKLPISNFLLDEPHAHADKLWGPYPSLDAASASIPAAMKVASFKFGVLSGGVFSEYIYLEDNGTPQELASLKVQLLLNPASGAVAGKILSLNNDLKPVWVEPSSTAERVSFDNSEEIFDGDVTTTQAAIEALKDLLDVLDGDVVKGILVNGSEVNIENGVASITIPDAVTSVLVNNELVFQTPDGQSVKGNVGITTGADGLLHLTLTDEEGHVYSSPIAGLRVVGNALQYSNDGENWVTVQTFGKLAIKYAQASDPASGDEGDLALVGTTNAYVLKVYVGGSWVSVCDFGTLDLTSDGITVAGENKTLTEKLNEIDSEKDFARSQKEWSIGTTVLSGNAGNISGYISNWNPLDTIARLKKVYFNRGFSVETPVPYVIAKKDQEDNYVVVRAGSITLAADETSVDLTSYNIVLQAGEIIAFNRVQKLVNSAWQYLYSDAASGNGANYRFTSSSAGAVGTASSIIPAYKIDYEYEDDKMGIIKDALLNGLLKTKTLSYGTATSNYTQLGGTFAGCFTNIMDVVDHARVVTKIDFGKTAESDIKLYYQICNHSNGAPVISGSGGELILESGKSTISTNIPLKANESIYMRMNHNIFGYYGTSPYTQYYFTSMRVIGTSPNVKGKGTSVSVEYEEITTIQDDVEKLKDELKEAGSNKLTVDDATVVLYTGSSLTQQDYAPKGLSYTERINDLVDVNIINAGVSGTTIDSNIDSLIANGTIKTDSLATPKSIKPNYILFNNTANDGVTPVSPEKQVGRLDSALKVCKALGAQMLLGGEGEGGNFGPAGTFFEAIYKRWARENNVHYVPSNNYWTRLYPSQSVTHVYKGSTSGGHGNYRENTGYLHQMELLNTIPIRKSVKMFKVRETYKSETGENKSSWTSGSISDVSDLVYENNYERCQKWRAVQCGAKGGSTGFLYINRADNIDDGGALGTYAPVSTDYSLALHNMSDNVGASEVSCMKRKGSITFYKWALIEFILEKVNCTKATFSVVSSVEPTAVYLAVLSNNGRVGDTLQVTSFVSLETTYEDGVVTAVIDRSQQDFQLGDKVRIVVNYADGASFTLANPILSDYDGNDKTIDSSAWDNWHYRLYGQELNDSTAMNDGTWLDASNNNAVVSALPTNIADYPTGYNNSKQHIALASDTDKIHKTITLQQPCTRLAVRIVCELFPKICSCRSAVSSSAYDDYVDRVYPTVRPCDFINGLLVVRFNGKTICRDIVSTGWTENYFEVDVEPEDTSLTIQIGRDTNVDESLLPPTWPLFVHAVSVQKIG